MYLFTWESNEGLLKAAHTMEIPFVFRNLDATPIVGTRADRFELADIVSDTWLAFARSGDPRVFAGLPSHAVVGFESYQAARRAGRE